MQQSKLFSVKQPDRRRNNRFIILATIGNFSLRHNPMSPDMESYIPYSTIRNHTNYYFENLEKKQMPFHFLLNEIKNDWEIFTAAPIHLKSDLIDKCIDSGYLSPFFKDAIVIAVQDDYTYRVPDERSYDIIASKTIIPLLFSMKMGTFRDSVFWLDEIFDYNKYKYDQENDGLNLVYPYKVKPMITFDRVIFNLSCRKYL